MKTIEDVMESLVARRAPHLPAQALADIFDRLIWCLDDGGAAIEVVRRKWLASDDGEKIAIALAMNEVFPCDSREEMTCLFQRLTARRPEFQQACEEIIDRWDEQHHSEPAGPHENRKKRCS